MNFMIMRLTHMRRWVHVPNKVPLSLKLSIIIKHVTPVISIKLLFQVKSLKVIIKIIFHC